MQNGMLLKMLFALMNECYPMAFDLPQEQNTQKHVYYVLSQQGIARYGEFNLDMAFKSLIGKPLDDINFTAGGFDFSLNHFTLVELTNPKVSVILSDDTNSGNIAMTDLRMLFKFEFSLLQQMYPFLEDSGSGQLHLSMKKLAVNMKVPNSLECPGAINITANEIICNVGFINIEFDSYLSFLLNAIMPLLNQYLVELFNKYLGTYLIAQFVEQINKEFSGLNPLGRIDYDYTVNFDQRWIGDVTINDRYFYIASNGMACNATGQKCDLKNYYPAPPRSGFKMNKDICYEITRFTFQSSYAYVWELNQSYLEQTLGIESLSVTVPRVAKTGLVTEMLYSRNGTQHKVQFLGAIRNKRSYWKADGVISVWTRPGLDHVTASDEQDEAFLERLRTTMDVVLDDYAFTAVNGYNVDFEHAQVVYVNNDWIVIGADIVAERGQ